MEVDISKKVNYAIKYGLPGLVLLALAASAAVWFWHSQQSYLVINDAKLTSAMVAARSSTPGTIEALLVEEGAKVEAGQVVAKIKVKVTPEQIQQLEQTLELAKKNYTSVLAGTVVSQPVGGSTGSGSQAEVERTAGKKARMDQLYELGAISAMQRDRAEAEYQAALAATQSETSPSYQSVSMPSSPEVIKAAQQQVNQAQTALEAAKKNMDATEVVAPVAGTVYYTNLLAGSEIEAGQPVLNIGDAANIWLEVPLTAAQQDKVRLGQFVSYKVEGHELQGTVLEVNELPADAGDAAPRYAAKVSLPLESQADLHPGMKAQVKIALN
ncbi:MAG: HlyD family secretion protein [Selenomonadaceae bacterium]